jgi:hypothetical protein
MCPYHDITTSKYPRETTMVTFYRKAQIERNSTNEQSAKAPNLILSGHDRESNYLGIISPEDELPYIVVRPKTNRKPNNKKILRMRDSWS